MFLRVYMKKLNGPYQQTDCSVDNGYILVPSLFGSSIVNFCEMLNKVFATNLLVTHCCYGCYLTLFGKSFIHGQILFKNDSHVD